MKTRIKTSKRAVYISNTVEPHCNGSQGTNNFYLLLVEFCYCQCMKSKKIYSWSEKLFPLLAELCY